MLGRATPLRVLRRASPSPATANASAVLTSSTALYHATAPARTHHQQQVSYTDELANRATMTVRTKCGRTFDSTIFRQLTEACQNPKWMEAIQRSLEEDTEYKEMMRDTGGALGELRRVMEEAGGETADEGTFLEHLRARLLVDEKTSLALCGLQDAFMRIRKHRDEQQARRIAAHGGDRVDPMEQFKQQNSDSSSVF